MTNSLRRILPQGVTQQAGQAVNLKLQNPLSVRVLNKDKPQQLQVVQTIPLRPILPQHLQSGVSTAQRPPITISSVQSLSGPIRLRCRTGVEPHKLPIIMRKPPGGLAAMASVARSAVTSQRQSITTEAPMIPTDLTTRTVASASQAAPPTSSSASQSSLLSASDIVLNMEREQRLRDELRNEGSPLESSMETTDSDKTQDQASTSLDPSPKWSGKISGNALKVIDSMLNH